MDAEEPIRPVRPEHVPSARVRMRLPDAEPDESMFFLIALVAGAICGYLVAII